jgi:hypothetical protein
MYRIVLTLEHQTQRKQQDVGVSDMHYRAVTECYPACAYSVSIMFPCTCGWRCRVSPYVVESRIQPAHLVGEQCTAPQLGGAGLWS